MVATRQNKSKLLPLQTLVEHFLCLPRNSHFDPLTYFQSKVSESQSGTMLVPIKMEVSPCHRLRLLSLFHVWSTKEAFFCMPSTQQFKRLSRSLSPYNTYFKARVPRMPMFIICASAAVDSVVCPKQCAFYYIFMIQ